MAETGKKLGKLGLAILEYLVECKLGQGVFEGLRARTGAEIALSGAMQATADCLCKDWADMRLWNAIFNHLPRKKELLTDLKQAVQNFYVHPADPGFAGVLTEILNERKGLSPEVIQKAVGEYITTLTEELLLVDQDFRENVRKQTNQRSREIQRRDEEYLVSQSPLPYQLTNDGTTSKHTEVDALLAARVELKKHPGKRIPKPSQQTDDGTTSKHAEEATLQAARVKLKKRPAKRIPKPDQQTNDGTISKHAEEATLQATRVELKKQPVKRIPKPDQQTDGGTISKHAEEAAMQAARVELKKQPVKKIPKPSQQTDGGTISKHAEEVALQAARVKLKKQPVKKIPKSYQQTDDGTTSKHVEEDALQAAQALLHKLPDKRIPKHADLPKGSRFPNISSNALFVGRKDSFKQLVAWIKSESSGATNQMAAITGMGGVGKSQLACEFARRYGRYFAGGVFWLSFAQPELIPSEVSACGGLADDSPLEIRVKQVLSEWQSGIPRLLIFDNCEDPNLLAQWRPPTGGSRILVTSRQSSWDAGLGVQMLSLGLLDRPESITLLRGFREDLNEDDPDLDAIAGELGDLPLALHMAGSLLNTYRHDMKPGQYLNALRQPRLLNYRSSKRGEFSPIGHDLGVGRALAIGVERASKENETDRLALDLLKRIACFAPGELIPRELIKTSAGAEKIGTTAFEDGVNRLLGMGLVEENEAGDVRMHRLVAWFVRDTLPGKGALAQVEKGVLSAAVDANRSGYPARMRPVLAHLKHLTDQALKERDKQAARLANELGYYLEVIADYPVARSYYQQALAINRKVLGEEHPDTTVSLNNLGGLLQVMGDYTAARPYYEQTLAIRKKALGGEHPDTARSLNNLGSLLQAMGDYTSARPYYEQALAIRRRVLGEEHPDTARSLTNLGGLLQVMGDYAGARPYYEQALAINRKVLGEEHPGTITSLNNLGGLLQVMGDYSGARSNYEQALAVNRKVLGEEHPGTVTSLNYLGGLFQAMGDYTAARPYFEQALAINRKVLGEDYPGTVSSLNNLGGLLQAMGDYTGARPYYEQALAIRRKVLGEEHPDTIRSLNNLGTLLQAMGDDAGAQLYYEQALAIKRKAMEEEQAKTATRIPFLQYSLRVKVALAVLFILSFAVISWQALARQGVSTTALNWIVPTPSGTVLPPLEFILGLSSKPTKTPTPRRTETPTRTPTAYYSPTIHLISLTPTKPSTPILIVKTKIPVPTNTPVPPPNTLIPPTNTSVPPPPAPTRTHLPPTNTSLPPTDAVPTNTQAPTPLPPPPTDTLPPPADTDTPVPPTSVPPTSVPPTSVPPTSVPPTSVPPPDTPTP
jgi:tetratricopeptide (TPR) repeat protein